MLRPREAGLKPVPGIPRPVRSQSVGAEARLCVCARPVFRLKYGQNPKQHEPKQLKLTELTSSD